MTYVGEARETGEQNYSRWADLVTANDEESADGSEDDTNDEECRKDCLWCQNRLPCLEPLLFECGIYVMWSARGKLAGRVKTHWPVVSSCPSPFWVRLVEKESLAESSSRDGREP